MNLEDKEVKSEWKKGKLSVRHTQAVLMFLCVTVCYIIRTSTSVTVIAMTDITESRSDFPIFNWDKKIQNYIMGSFYWGYVIFLIPISHLIYRYGAKWFLGLALLINGILSLIIPYVAEKGGWQFVCLCRSLQGVAQGCMIPSIHTLLGRWAPFPERNRMGNTIYTGSTLGTIIALPISGYLSSTKYGWPLIFKVIGIISLSVSALWLIFGADSPSKHRSISDKERHFIETSLEKRDEEKISNVPWKRIITCKPFLATVIAHVGGVYGFTTMFLEMPSFLKASLGTSISETGFLSTIPYIMCWIFEITFSILADYMINKKIMKVTTVRKTANTFGSWGPALAMMILILIPQNHNVLTMMLTILVVSLDAVGGLGFFINYIDLSPRYGGMLAAFGNFIAVIFTNASPIITGLILKDPTDMKQWGYVFLMPIMAYFFSNLVFLIFAKGDKQDWDEPKVVNGSIFYGDPKIICRLINKEDRLKIPMRIYYKMKHYKLLI